MSHRPPGTLPPLVSLEEARRAPVEEVVEDIELLLERAKAGEVRGFACAAVLPGGSTLTVRSPGEASDAELFLALSDLSAGLLLARRPV